MFIAIAKNRERTIEEAKDFARQRMIISSGGPYESSYMDKAIAPLLEEYGKISNMFSEDSNSDKSLEHKIKELHDLSNDLNKE